MLAFISTRAIRSVITLWVVFTLVFFGARLSGNALEFMFPEGLAETVRAELILYYGLDGSNLEQYWKFWRGIFEGNFGISLFEFRPVTEIYAERIGNTLQLFLLAFVFSIVLSQLQYQFLFLGYIQHLHPSVLFQLILMEEFPYI